MKTSRIRAKVKSYLKGQRRSTAEVLEYINNTFRHGTTINVIGNVLSKDKDIVKVGYVKRKGMRYGSYDISEWALKEDLVAESESL